MINITISDEPKQSVVAPVQSHKASRVVKTVKRPASSTQASALRKKSGRKQNKLFRATGRLMKKVAPVAQRIIVPGIVVKS